ncbi:MULTISPECIES: asparagine synthase-related protein [Burkholderia]|uniref:asparagine synthase-related protein n=1 Tax=Burkholderia TaxID=32008 RepID=UPI00084190BA|nr:MULTISPECIES: asparagine synthase-related protein [unclassified Burkholderia]AOK31581.1 hypothetical protein AQ611_18685 [Burkholderia sp. Bp7605]
MAYAVLQPSMRQEPASQLAHERVWATEAGCVAVFATTDSARGQAVTFGEDARAAWVANGRLFAHGDGARAAAADVVRAALIDYEDVSRRYWGDYSLIIYDKRSDDFLILMDPCGQCPVFYHQAVDGAMHVGDTISELITLAGLPQEPDAHYLSQYAAYGCGEPTQTGWQGISLLPPGFAMRWKRGRPPELRRAWSPWNWHRRRASRDFIDVLTMVQRSMLDGESKIFLELSGGIDSTSLAVGLKRTELHRRTVAVTHFDPARASSNEVSIARAVAEHCGIEHQTYPLLARLPFTPFERPPAVPRPGTRLCFLAHDAGFAQSGLADGGGVMLNGHGGDSLYLAPPPFSAVVDAVTGLRAARVAGALRDLAIQYRLPIWTVLAQAWRETAKFFGEPAVQPAMTSVVPSGVKPPTIGLYHDVLRHASLRLKPGRRYQIAILGASLEDGLVHIGAGSRRPVMPFLSQPVIEHALRSPIEDMFSADHSRLPVRRSVFAASGLPNLWRTDKGDIMHSALAGIKAYHAHVRETCAGGWCAARGLVDPDGMAKLIKRAALGYPVGMVEITRIYSIEMFVRGLAGSA